MASKKLANRYTAITILLAVVLALSLSTVLLQKAVAPNTRYVTVSGFAFSPQTILIQHGDTIAWNNNDPVIHTLWFVRISDGSTYLLSDPILPGETWSHTFTEKLNLQYYSFGRLWITGFIEVLWKGDVNKDDVVDGQDIVIIIDAIPSYPGHGLWNPYADINGDNVVDGQDAVICIDLIPTIYP
jgi:plastocyanin